jgi:glycosyltransferase involved in cell wall biosynthesis
MPKNDVTVVIPTRNRPQMVVGAVKSALAQTYPIAEVMVVVDGADDSTVEALENLGDPRVRCFVLPVNGGANKARNQGAANSTTEWVAFLDDDDEWLPEKIERQLAIGAGYDIVSCRFSVRSAKDTLIWPRRLPAAGERFGDYLFSRRSFFKGDATVTTSTLLVRKCLLDKTPLSTGLRRHQEADWVIRTTDAGARIAYAPESLLIFNDDIGRTRISTSNDWRESLEWVHRMKAHLSPRSYAGFVLATVGAAASSQRDWSAFGFLLRDAFRGGRPALLHLSLYFGMWAFPRSLRHRMRSFLWRTRQSEPNHA